MSSLRIIFLITTSSIEVVAYKMSDTKTILVTGSTGVVGSGIQYIIETEESHPDEQWIFVSSKDADLRLVNSEPFFGMCMLFLSMFFC